MHSIDKTTIKIGLVILALMIIYLGVSEWLFNNRKIAEINADQKLQLATIDQETKANAQSAEAKLHAIAADKETKIHAINALQLSAETKGKAFRVIFGETGMSGNTNNIDKKSLLKRIL